MADSPGATKSILKDIAKIYGAETIHAYFKFNGWFSMILQRNKWLWTVWECIIFPWQLHQLYYYTTAKWIIIVTLWIFCNP